MTSELLGGGELATWATNTVIAGVIGLLVFLAQRWQRHLDSNFEELRGALEKSTEKLSGEMRQQAQSIQGHEQRLALGNQAFSQMREDLQRLERRVDDLSSLLGSEWRRRKEGG